jgi:hypothetical protein
VISLLDGECPFKGLIFVFIFSFYLMNEWIVKKNLKPVTTSIQRYIILNYVFCDRLFLGAFLLFFVELAVANFMICCCLYVFPVLWSLLYCWIFPCFSTVIIFCWKKINYLRLGPIGPVQCGKKDFFHHNFKVNIFLIWQQNIFSRTN